MSRVQINSPQTRLVVWTSRVGCEKHRFLGCSFGDPDFVNMGSSDSVNTGSAVNRGSAVYAEPLHLLLEIHEQFGEGWRWQMNFYSW